MQKKSIINDLTEGNVSKTLITFSIPFMLSNLLQITYNITDMIIVGQYVGSTGLASVSVGGDIMNLFMLVGMGFTTAGQILISQSVGQHKHEYVKKIIGVMFTFLSMMAVTATILGFFLNDWLLNIMNVPEEAYVQAKEYSTVCYMGMIFIFGYNIVSAILRGMGDSKRPFIIIAVATSLNLIFDLVLVAGLGMGPKGAAIATVSGQGLSFIGSIIYLYVKKDQFGFDFKLNSFKMDFKVLKALVRLGVPLALQHSAIVISKLFVNSSINFYGVTAAAVNGVGARIRQISFVVCNALGMASTSMIGQNFGAGKKKRIVKVIYVSMGIGLVFAAILSVAILMFPEQIFSVFNNDPEVLEMSHVYSIIAMLGFVASALRSPMMGLINGLGNTKLSMLLGLLDGVIARVGLAVLLGTTLGMGIKGYWYGDALAGFIPFIIGGVYFWSGMWKKRRLAMA